MAALLDTSILIGPESTYGTAATLTRGYEGQVDNFTPVADPLESVGFRGGMDAMRSDRRIQIHNGATSTLTFDAQNAGLGLLLQAMFGTVSGPTQEGVTTAYTTTASSDSVEPAISYTAQANRVAVDGTNIPHTYEGGKVTGWNVTQNVAGLLVMALDFDFEDVNTATAAGTPAYPASTSPFHWGQAVVSINSVATDAISFAMTGDLGLKTDRRFLRGSTLKKEPIRNAVPTWGGTIEIEYTDDTEYDLFRAGTIVPISCTWTGALIESPHNYAFSLTMAACMLDVASPVASLSDVPTVSIPFVAMDDGSNPSVVATYTSVDTSL